MYDTAIVHGTIIDGTGKEKYRADIGIKDGIIRFIGEINPNEATETIDADGLYVTPGFVDVLNHSDTHWRVFSHPQLESLLYQGITTIIGGNCGISLAPVVYHREISDTLGRWSDTETTNISWSSMEEFLAEVESQRLGLNFATLVGYGTIRRSIVRDKDRKLTQGEIHLASQWMEDALEQGAIGASLGLVFSSDKSASAEEIESIARAVASSNGVLAVHLRNETSQTLESIHEVLQATRDSHVKTHISHLKVMGRKNWNAMDEILVGIDAACKEGVDLTFDVFPYTATGSLLYTLLPPLALDGGMPMMLARLRHFETRMEILARLEKKQHDYSKIFVSLGSVGLASVRKSVSEAALIQNKRPEEIVLDIVAASQGKAIAVVEALSETNVEKAIRHPKAMISTDSSAQDASAVDRWQVVHPRSFGAFARLLGRYVREKKLLSWEEAVYKISGMPAKRYGLTKRGVLSNGNHADIALIDPESILDMATLEKPNAYSVGVRHLLIAGNRVIRDGVYTQARCGKVLRKE